MILSSKVENLETNRKDVAIYFKPGVWHLDLVAPFLCEDMSWQTHSLCAIGSRRGQQHDHFTLGLS